MALCRNCNIAIHADQQYDYNALNMSSEIVSILEEWITQEVTDGDCICQECMNLLLTELNNRNEHIIGDRQLGHQSVCVWCGISISRRTGRRSRPLMDDHPEWGYVAGIISPRQIPANGRACNACWQRAHSNIQQVMEPPRESQETSDNVESRSSSVAEPEINDCFEEFNRANKNNKKVAKQAAENIYNNFVTSAWGPQMCCFHPKALEDLHKQAVEATLEECLTDRDEEDEDEEYKTEITETLERRFLELVTVNEYNNERAVEQAVWVYTMKMGKIHEPPAGSFWQAVVRALANREKWKPSQNHHEECKRDAVQVFKNRRRGAEYPDDKYYNDVIKTVDTAYRNQ